MQKKGANISLKGYDDIFSTDQSRAEAQQERVQEIPLSELHPFEGHPFRVVDDEEMMKTAESVRDFGVLTPAIVRPDPDGGYEIVSGHRRHRASELAGIVIQNDTGNKHAPTLIVATVTTRIHKKANMPTHFVIYDNPAFKEASVVQLEQIRTIDKSRIDNYLGKVTPREMVAIEKALSVSLAMEQLKKRSPKHKAKRAKE